ncbi:prephenate dehydrogenase dimerization domain-containing protein, partial [Rhodococcus chondri]
PAAAALRQSLPRQQVLGLNPMFAPDLGLRGRPVVAVRHRDGPDVTAMVRAVRGWDAHVVELTADEHDRVAGAAQALTHAAVLAFGLALARLDPPAATAATAPPPHVLLRTLLARVASGAPEVYHDVQAANPYAADARRALRTALDDLDTAAAGTDAGFAALMARARAPLGAELAPYRRLCAQVFTELPPAHDPNVHLKGVP